MTRPALSLLAEFERICRHCGATLSRRVGEKLGDWKERKYCNRDCFTALRARLAYVGPEKKSARRARPEYSVWRAMVQRCTNPNSQGWRHYGGRGITVCDEWRSFDAFFVAVGPRPSGAHSIERIDNERGYEPGNVRWATRAEQARNKRTNRYLTAFGKTQTIGDWAAALGLCTTTLIARLDRKWPLEIALANGPKKGRRLKHHREHFRVAP
jgi:hypothetical protein